ncbi:MAG: phenylalanine--tRNA ligase subunit beta, partial [Bacilli bacterium]|nr:phenylalanine--tRNA ligase subunit beta [Bacilli bacterium]
MAISMNWVNDYVSVEDIDLRLLANKITTAGINIEKVENKKINNLVIGQVLECEDHKDSDHLHVCQVDVKSQVYQIVCGAPNVHKGMKVIVALPGAILPGNFEIKTSTIRGVTSNGMLCALFELGKEEKTEENYNKGIHEVTEEIEIGTDANIYLGFDDTSYELDLNPNRFDCNNHIPFSYEVAAVLGKKVNLPTISYSPIKDKVTNHMNLKVETDNCTMYNLKMVTDVKIGPSPEFIKRRLEIAGMRSINNIVDISNYVMLEYGQPLHFFDKKKIGDTILVRMAKDNEIIETLDKKERVLSNKDIVITDGNKPICIAGVMGGINSGIDDNTTTIVIESA